MHKRSLAKVTTAVTLASLISTTPALSAAQSNPCTPTRYGWSQRGVFVFGAVVLDFRRGVEKVDNAHWRTLRNCSDLRFFCARGQLVRLTLPRFCEDLHVGRWSIDGVTTEVVARTRRPPTGDPGREMLLLADPERPNTVYLYDRGVEAIFHDFRGEHDLAAVAHAGGLDALDNLTAEDPSLRLNLSTLDVFGQCNETAEPIIP